MAIVWAATVINPGTSTPSALVRYLIDRNSLLLVRDHAGRLAVCVRALLMLANGMRQMAGAASKPAGKGRQLFKARCYAVVDFFRGNLGKPSRKELMKRSS